jgi:Fe-Mn family superoxide dismutase
MSFELPPLPYAKDALVPHMSAETFDYHHGKHHAAYVAKLNELTQGKPDANKSVEEIVRSSEGVLFNQAAQVWNHTFFWSCMKPGGGGTPKGDLADAINRDFGSVDKFKEAFSAAAAGRFGSGWAWLVLSGGKLEVVSTANQDNPISDGQEVVLGNDVWEHAYYLKYRNRRPEYLGAWWNVVNWDVVSKRFDALK